MQMSYKIIDLPCFMPECPSWYQQFARSMLDRDHLVNTLLLYDAAITKSSHDLFSGRAYHLNFYSAEGYTRFCLEWM